MQITGRALLAWSAVLAVVFSCVFTAIARRYPEDGDRPLDAIAFGIVVGIVWPLSVPVAIVFFLAMRVVRYWKRR